MIRDQAQKELLDAELDFHKKMSSGEDTTDLKRKLGQLQVEVIHARARTHTQPQTNNQFASSAFLLRAAFEDVIPRNSSEALQ